MKNDLNKKFLDDMCKLSEGERVRSLKFYFTYRIWAKENGVQPIKHSDFDSAMAHFGIIKKRMSDGVYYYGVSLVNSAY